MHKLPVLPYSFSALAPLLSQDTLEFHYGKHHKGYLDNLNKLIIGTEFENLDLDETVKKSQGIIFNNSAQVLNHNFYWDCLSPNGGKQQKGLFFDSLEKNFSSFEVFKKDFSLAALSVFGSGWAWLVKTEAGTLKIVTTANAETPFTNSELKVLLACDVWEHAYYLDYKNARNRYLEVFWDLVNWDFVSRNF